MRKKLIELRKSKDLSQENMAKILAIGRSTYNAYELGTVDPPLRTALKIKKFFKYEKDDIFFNGENDNLIVN